MKALKRGFTIVELAIVIAVIAVLAAVLIPTVSKLVYDAQVSTDKQAAKEMSVALSASEPSDGVPANMNELIGLLEKNGYSADVIFPSCGENFFAWDKTSNQILYFDQNAELLFYSKDYQSEKAELWRPMRSLSETVDGFNVYLMEDYTGDCNVSSDLVVANGKQIDGTLTVDQPVSITVEGDVGRIVVDNPQAEVSHNGQVGTVEVKSVAPDSYYEYGSVVQTLSVWSGHVVLGEGAEVAKTYLDPSQSAEVRLTVYCEEALVEVAENAEGAVTLETGENATVYFDDSKAGNGYRFSGGEKQEGICYFAFYLEQKEGGKLSATFGESVEIDGICFVLEQSEVDLAVDLEEGFACFMYTVNGERENNNTFLMSERSAVKKSATVNANLAHNSKTVNGVVYALNSNNPMDDVAYSIEGPSDDNAIASFEADGKWLILENEIDGYPVTAITAGAFSGRSLKNVVVPENIVTVGSNAFKDNFGIRTIVFLGDEVTLEGGGASSPFYGCSEKYLLQTSVLKIYYTVLNGSDWSEFTWSGTKLKDNVNLFCDNWSFVTYDLDGLGEWAENFSFSTCVMTSMQSAATVKEQILSTINETTALEDNYINGYEVEVYGDVNCDTNAVRVSFSLQERTKWYRLDLSSKNLSKGYLREVPELVLKTGGNIVQYDGAYYVQAGTPVTLVAESLNGYTFEWNTGETLLSIEKDSFVMPESVLSVCADYIPNEYTVSIASDRMLQGFTKLSELTGPTVLSDNEDSGDALGGESADFDMALEGFLPLQEGGYLLSVPYVYDTVESGKIFCTLNGLFEYIMEQSFVKDILNAEGTQVREIGNIDGDVSLELDWKPLKNRIVYHSDIFCNYENLNDGKEFVYGSGKGKTVIFSEEVDYKLEVPTKEGYTFLGWWSDPSDWAPVGTREGGSFVGENEGNTYDLYALWLSDVQGDMTGERSFKWGSVGKDRHIMKLSNMNGGELFGVFAAQAERTDFENQFGISKSDSETNFGDAALGVETYDASVEIVAKQGTYDWAHAKVSFQYTYGMYTISVSAEAHATFSYIASKAKTLANSTVQMSVTLDGETASV